MKLTLAMTRSALRELNPRVRRYGESFRERFKEWVRELADYAERGQHVFSEDAMSFLRVRGETPLVGMKRWRRETIPIKIHAAFVWLRTRQPAWEFRVATRNFLVTDTLGVYRESATPVTMIYEINRPKKRVVVIKFIDLPPT